MSGGGLLTVTRGTWQAAGRAHEVGSTLVAAHRLAPLSTQSAHHNYVMPAEAGIHATLILRTGVSVEAAAASTRCEQCYRAYETR